uniref:Uncharacterized protein n=1 Tax=Daphnia galeata TaxID=27404 RepID=A0A8J2RTI5_9CRUS|nr:unnamed protein product [Daphnia galeata]
MDFDDDLDSPTKSSRKDKDLADCEVDTVILQEDANCQTPTPSKPHRICASPKNPPRNLFLNTSPTKEATSSLTLRSNDIPKKLPLRENLENQQVLHNHQLKANACQALHTSTPGKFKSIFINCMLLHTPASIFQHITQQLDPKWTAAAEEALPSCGRQTVALGPLFQNLLPGCSLDDPEKLRTYLLYWLFLRLHSRESDELLKQHTSLEYSNVQDCPHMDRRQMQHQPDYEDHRNLRRRVLVRALAKLPKGLLT